MLSTIFAAIAAQSDTLAQVTDSIASTAAATTPADQELSVWSLCLKGGIIMIPLAILSIISIYILIERYLAITAAAKEDNTFMKRIKDYIHDGEIESAMKLCRRTDTPYSRLIMKGISRIGRPMNDVLVAIENVGNMEVAKLEKGLTIMATISSGAPMIGFLGTVIGMVRAFWNMANAGNNIDITTLSGGIYEAMITTVGGLIVGIIAMFSYNYLVTLIDGVINKMEAKTMAFMDLLYEPEEKK